MNAITAIIIFAVISVCELFVSIEKDRYGMMVLSTAQIMGLIPLIGLL